MRIETLLAGNSLHLEIVPEGTATLYFAEDGEVHALLPSGTRDTGRWTLRSPDTYCIDWQKGPQGSCTRVQWLDGVATLFDPAGKPRGRVKKVVPGRDPALP